MAGVVSLPDDHLLTQPPLVGVLAVMGHHTLVDVAQRNSLNEELVNLEE